MAGGKGKGGKGKGGTEDVVNALEAAEAQHNRLQQGGALHGAHSLECNDLFATAGIDDRDTPQGKCTVCICTFPCFWARLAA